MNMPCHMSSSAYLLLGWFEIWVGREQKRYLGALVWSQSVL